MATSLMDILKQAGFKGDALKMAYAIAMAESGGNANAHNGNAGTGDNSYGLFQINMLGAMGPERRAQYGLSSNSDLFDPLTNAKVAYKMSNGGKNWGPWSTYKNGAYEKYYGGSSATVSGSGGSSKSVATDKATAAEQYGFVQSLLNSNGELKNLFNKAVKSGWSTDKFQAELRDTKWWKTHSEQERNYLTKRYGDPASAKQDYDQALVHVRQLASQLGVQKVHQTGSRLNAWAYDVAAKGWTDDQLRYEMGKYVYFGNGVWAGQGGEEQEKLHSFAYDLGVTMSGTWYANASRDIVRGLKTEADFQNQLRKQAKALFPQWTKQIDAGQNVIDLASPYLQSMSQILELPQGSLNLFDPTIKKALQFKDPSTGSTTGMALWQFENTLRSDPRWKKTQNAQNSLMQVAHQVLADFGLKY